MYNNLLNSYRIINGINEIAVNGKGKSKKYKGKKGKRNNKKINRPVGYRGTEWMDCEIKPFRGAYSIEE